MAKGTRPTTPDDEAPPADGTEQAAQPPIVTLRGNLVRDPELRYTKGGKAVCDARLAVNGEDGQARFYTVTLWENQAEAVAQVCKKGDQLGARGRLERRTWTGNDGVERSEDVLMAFVVELYRRKASGNGGAA